MIDGDTCWLVRCFASTGRNDTKAAAQPPRPFSQPQSHSFSDPEPLGHSRTQTLTQTKTNIR